MQGSTIINSTPDKTGVTSFVAEACEGVHALGNYRPAGMALPQSDLQDVKAYFERPRLISRGTVTFGTVAQLTPGFAFRSDMATLISIFPQWTQRLAGAYGVRFTLNFKLQVAATSFHQGLIAMAWQYGKTGLSDSTFARAIQPYSCTNVPHVRLNLADQTMVELKVPFLYTAEYMQVTENTTTPFSGDYGQLAIVSVLPSLSVSGISPATYDLYCYMTDIELFGVDVINPQNITLQSGDTLSSELRSTRVISKTLDSASTALSFVARNIPALSSLAGPAHWATSVAAGVARYFGYSRPLNQDSASKVFRTNFAADCHVDQPMTGEALGLFQGNTTVIDTSLGATDVDEMALAFISQQWSQVCRGSIATGNAHGATLYAAPLSPSVMWFRAPASSPFCNVRFPSNSAGLISNSGNSFMPSSLMYISSVFRYWRGSIKFRFTFAKTKLHGGRLMVTYNPDLIWQPEINNFGGTVSGPETVSSLRQPYGNTMIIDLKDDNVFEFTCNYQSHVPWTSFASSIGGITMVVLDPLQVTGTVSSTIPFLVEVCGGPDYELSDYAGNYFPLLPDGTVYTQAGGDSVSTTTADVAPHTMGEKVTSVKQLIMAPVPDSLYGTPESVSSYYLSPWFVNSSYGGISASKALPFPNVPSAVFAGAAHFSACVAKCYAFCKGGTDFHFYPQHPTTKVKVAQYSGESGVTATANTSLARRCFPSAVPQVIQTASLANHVRVPSFQTVARIPTTAYDTLFSVPYPALAPVGVIPYLGHLFKVIIDTLKTDLTEEVEVYRSASDDAQLAHYMGPVPVMIPGVLQTSAIDPNGSQYL